MPDLDRLQKDDDLIHQIYVTMRLFTKNLNEIITPYEVYSSEWTIINYLHHHDEISQADLAAALQIEAAAVSKTIGKMEKKGLVTRLSAKDKREKHISMTPKCRALFPQLAASVARQRQQSLAGISEKTRQDMLQMMKTMFDNLKNSH